MAFLRRLILYSIAIFGLLMVTLLSARIGTLSTARLEPWHTLVPNDLDARDIDATTWTVYSELEEELFAVVNAEMSKNLPPDQHSAYNRYDSNSLVFPPRLTRNWNRSYISEPSGLVKGAVVLLHGLTDSPYSLRHVATHFQAKGFVAVAVRMPGHGTVPGGLTAAQWEDWMAATRLAVREAKRRLPSGAPLYIVGFSNGGALAVKYALDAIENPDLAKATGLVLISPMIGVSRYARFAGIAGLPAIFPSFAKAAWLGIVPEFNPFKYNSFPVNAARQTYELTRALQRQLVSLSSLPAFKELPPILTYQSLTDHTVSTRAVKNSLYDLLPPNGSELVIFDTNRSLPYDALVNPSVQRLRSEFLQSAERAYSLTLISARGRGDGSLVAYRNPAQQLERETYAVDGVYPPTLVSLSHVALPFPTEDALYGQQGTTEEDYGVRLGMLSVRGERGALIIDADTFSRATSNPFFSFTMQYMDRFLGLE